MSIKNIIFPLLLATVVGLSGCSKNQDDIDLPVFDALGGDFTLPSTLGSPLTLSDYKGRVVLINFGYSSCPDICPMVLGHLSKVSKQLKDAHSIDAKQLQVIFITVDPERDAIDKLVKYLAFFDGDFVGVRGTIEQTSELAKKYAVFFEKQAEENMNYQVAHTDKIFLLDKRGRLRGLYSSGDQKEKLIKDIVSLAEAEI